MTCLSLPGDCETFLHGGFMLWSRDRTERSGGELFHLPRRVSQKTVC